MATTTRTKNPLKVAAAKKSWQQRTRFDYDTKLYFSSGTWNFLALGVITTHLLQQCVMNSSHLSISIQKKRLGSTGVTIVTSLPREMVSASIASVKQLYPDFTAVVVTAPRQPIARISSATKTPSTSRVSHGR